MLLLGVGCIELCLYGIRVPALATSREHSLNISRNQRIQRLQQQLTDMRAAGIGTTPEMITQKLEEETKVNAYIVTEKLPRELAGKKAAVESLEVVLNQPAMTQARVLH